MSTKLSNNNNFDTVLPLPPAALMSLTCFARVSLLLESPAGLAHNRLSTLCLPLR